MAGHTYFIFFRHIKKYQNPRGNECPAFLGSAVAGRPACAVRTRNVAAAAFVHARDPVSTESRANAACTAGDWRGTGHWTGKPWRGTRCWDAGFWPWIGIAGRDVRGGCGKRPPTIMGSIDNSEALTLGTTMILGWAINQGNVQYVWASTPAHGFAF